jgi:drug/metabolite transporter (DMT)-like permease
MKTKLWAIIVMVFTTLLTSMAQAFYKLGVPSLKFNLVSILTNYWIILGLIVYVIAAGLMITAFKGGELSVLYPIVALSYIWVAIISTIFLKEHINLLRWSGIISIFFGILFISLGGNSK